MLSQAFALLLLTALTSADLLKNPDFESPPTGLPKAATPSVVLLNENNTIPGWTFSGTVAYLTANESFPLPGGGHALLLLEEGKVNQTFVAAGDLTEYLLTFSVANGGVDCVFADVVVSAPDSTGVFSFEKKYGKLGRQNYGNYLGAWGDGESVDLVVHSQTSEDNSSAICWPVIDELILKSMPKSVVPNAGNLILNPGFELGPGFPSNWSEGIILGPSLSPLQSPLLDWAVLGTVRYIDSDHFLVPQGKAAVEILASGLSSGLQTAVQLVEGSTYNLDFKLGDANNSCVGDFVVGAQAGSKAQNFTLSSLGTGSAKNFTIIFKADSSAGIVAFTSYTTSETKDGVLCGPVVDDVVLRGMSASSGARLDKLWLFPVSLLVIASLW